MPPHKGPALLAHGKPRTWGVTRAAVAAVSCRLLIDSTPKNTALR